MCVPRFTRTRSDMATLEKEVAREAEIDRELASAVVARFLARVLAPPGAPHPQRLARESPEEGLKALESAALLLDGSSGGPLARCVEALVTGSPPESGASERLFGHTLRGAVCPYESEYGRRALIQQAHELADLAGFYGAFGLKAAGHHRERPDHVACELEFLEFLSRKVAYALEIDDGEMLAITRLAIGKFLSEHLGRFGRAFAVSLQVADPDGYYGSVGSLCEHYLASECERFAVPLGPAMLELRSAREEEVPMACGSGDELVQLGGLGDLEE